VCITAWRIVKARHAANAFDGEGARVEGGRWNSPGTPVVYTSQSAALAALELLVHLGRGSILRAYVLVPCTFDEAVVSRLDRQRLPRNWRSYPAPPDLQSIGDEWVKSGRSAVLEVPSAVIETESNYLLNPHHRDFHAVALLTSQPFEFDLRLLKPVSRSIS
jgi:RES domain-containing protein